MEKRQVLKDYPKTAKLRNGEEVVLRLMSQADEAALLEFFKSLPESDRLFLREDVTDPQVIHLWARNLDYNKTVPILVFKGEKIIGDATLHMQTHGWSRHVGEIRLAVSKEFRGQGLGFLLIKEIFFLALAMNLEKVVGQVMENQAVVFSILKSLGFKQEAVLKDHVKDLLGNKHNLIIMTNDVKTIWKRMEDLIRDSLSDKSGWYRF